MMNSIDISIFYYFLRNVRNPIDGAKGGVSTPR
jgi:hypothetical protein